MEKQSPTFVTDFVTKMTLHGFCDQNRWIKPFTSNKIVQLYPFKVRVYFHARIYGQSGFNEYGSPKLPLKHDTL
jgi:hypothetical protein